MYKGILNNGYEQSTCANISNPIGAGKNVVLFQIQDDNYTFTRVQNMEYSQDN